LFRVPPPPTGRRARSVSTVFCFSPSCSFSFSSLPVRVRSSSPVPSLPAVSVDHPTQEDPRLQTLLSLHHRNVHRRSLLRTLSPVRPFLPFPRIFYSMDLVPGQMTHPSPPSAAPGQPAARFAPQPCRGWVVANRHCPLTRTRPSFGAPQPRTSARVAWLIASLTYLEDRTCLPTGHLSPWCRDYDSIS